VTTFILASRERYRQLFVIAATVAAASMSIRAHVRTTAVTWSSDIAPLVQKRCLGCHVPDGSSGVPLDSYERARALAPQIKRAVLEHRMPPWPAARGFGDFANDRSLSPIETSLFVAWIDGGSPNGGAADIALSPDVASASGAPASDLHAITLQADARSVSESVASFELPTGLTQAAWFAAWEFQPGNRALVEQADLSIAGGDRIGTWVPPEGITRFPPGVAQRLPAGSRLAVTVFYKKTRGPATDRSRVVLYPSPPPRRMLRHQRLSCGSWRVPGPIEVLALRPSVPRSGERFEAIARRPDGAVDALCWIHAYQLRYEPTYRFRRPVQLPAATDVVLHSTEPACNADLEYVAR
jgi:hypothetical protein